MDENVVLEMKNIRKTFPGVMALGNVSLTLRLGKAHGLLGENGAGKSTLMKVLTGTYADYEGSIIYAGQPVKFKNEKEALDAGIAIVAQELNYVPELTVAENIFLGREPRLTGFIFSKNEMLRKASGLFDDLGLDINPSEKMKNLRVAECQLVEIVKAISRNSKIIVMDEPTSALTAVESEYLFTQVDKLKVQGAAFVFISHKLDEVYRICDEVTVLRDGNWIGSAKIEDVSQDALITMMVGRDVSDIYPDLAPIGKDTVLQIKNFSRKGVFQDINFELHRGEILGFAGMMGAGRSEIMRCIFGLDRYDDGAIFLEEYPLQVKSTKDAINAGIVMVTEDRRTYGFVGVRSISDNIVLPNSDIFSKFGILLKKRIDQKVAEICGRLKVKAPNYNTLVGNLSGGNQQKVVLCKWLIQNVKVLIIDEPTRGIDVGAKQEIYKLIAELAEQGMSVILVSSEMPEVLSMSHRIIVIAEGRQVGQVLKGTATQDDIMKIIIENGGKHDFETTANE